jgi:hypothetical protein
MDVGCRACSILGSKCKVYVLPDYKPASQEIISGKGIKENMKIPL